MPSAGPDISETFGDTFGADGDPHWVDDRQQAAQDEPGPAQSRWAGFLGRFSRSTPSNGAYAPVENGNDGVFGNLVAKDETQARRARAGTTDDDDANPDELPPSYEEAAADSTPSYWETTIMASGWCDEVLVDDLPVGSMLHFGWNILVSSAFSVVGFFITFVFHTSHAARAGSIVGFGITLIQWSYAMSPDANGAPGAPPKEFHPNDPNSFNSGNIVGTITDSDGSMRSPFEDAGQAESESMSRNGTLLFYLGALIIAKGTFDYLRARSMKRAILQYQSQGQSPESTEISGDDDPNSQLYDVDSAHVEAEEGRIHRSAVSPV